MCIRDRGQEVVSGLIHLTDSSQNGAFRDHYFEDLDLDVSRALFVFSFNDEARLNPVLRDRLTVIRTGALRFDDKRAIARRYLLPRLLQNVGLAAGDVTLEDSGVRFLAGLEREEGVRRLRAVGSCARP